MDMIPIKSIPKIVMQPELFKKFSIYNTECEYRALCRSISFDDKSTTLDYFHFLKII